jgi:hypothetical protein
LPNIFAKSGSMIVDPVARQLGSSTCNIKKSTSPIMKSADSPRLPPATFVYPNTLPNYSSIGSVSIRLSRHSDGSSGSDAIPSMRNSRNGKASDVIKNFKTITINQAAEAATVIKDDHRSIEFVSSSSESSSSESSEDDEENREARRRRQVLRRRNKKNWFNIQNIVAMPAPNEHDEGETGNRSTKTRVDSWWSIDEYKSLSKKTKERQLTSKLNHSGSREMITAEKRYQPRPYKVWLSAIDLQTAYNTIWKQ